MKLKTRILLAIFAVFSQVSVFAGPSEPVTTLKFDFDFSKGQSHSFQAVFRDLPFSIYQNYEKRVAAGVDLGPEAPLTQPTFEYPEENSHWLLNAGIYPLPDGLKGHGFLVQGNNHSDDLDMFLVRKFDSKMGLRPNTKYVLRVTVDLAGDAPAGAIGVGGAPELNLRALVVTELNPTQYRIDENGDVRHSNQRAIDNPKSQADVGTNAVCTVPEESSELALNYENPCPDDLKIPFQMKRGSPSAPISFMTDSRGEFWLMIGGHSGFESFTGIYYTRFQIEISPATASSVKF